MLLENFIEETLVSICNGIKNAKNKLNTDNAIIAPGRVEGNNVTELSFIDFQVSITVNENNHIQVEGDVSVKANIGIAKSEGSTSGILSKKSEEENKHKIRFSIPYLPAGVGYVKSA